MTPSPQRYKLILEYDGTHFHGWQSQPGLQTVQGVLEQALKQLAAQPITTAVAGRTDAGVHATGQVAHADLPTPYAPFAVRNALNAFIGRVFECPQPLSVLEVEAVSDTFNARFSAVKRAYRYIIEQRSAPLALEANRAWHLFPKLDVGRMQEAAQYLIGTHDFSSFRARDCQAQSPIRTLDKFEIFQEGTRIFADIEARSFLHHQVRNMMGTLRLVGQGRWTPLDLKHALDAKNRTKAGETAPPHGLYLVKVTY